MPLPFIPILLGAAALITSGYGVKKGLDAKEDFDRAESIIANARSIYDKASRSLERTREDAQDALEELGKIKLKAVDEGLKPFAAAFEKIKNVELDEDIELNPELSITTELADIQKIVLEISDVLKGGIAAVSGGALAGFGAFGAAGMLATASTGTAISALSGVAATNATLAWFGGGALAAGGLGMAGGTLVLGGIVAAPVLAVGGLLLASKAEEAVNDARSNLEKAKGAAEGMEIARTAAKAILRCTEEIGDVLKTLLIHFLEANGELKALVDRETDYQVIKTNARDRYIVQKSCGLARTVTNILETPVFDDNGVVTQATKELTQNSRQFLEKLAAM